MLNAEHPVQNVEGRYNVPSTRYKVGIRIGIEILVFKDLGTLYLVLRTKNPHFDLKKRKHTLQCQHKPTASKAESFL